uniref:DegT/DnrJ/EryC1/StrS aminotransferase n=1 Tax=Solibacter usitatus (strain Ellin6076) TaxID=234267 RepID=Q01XL3_SOLUE
MNTKAKRLVKVLLRQTIGRVPPSVSRLTGRLAKDGGQPVRDTRLRPWASYQAENRSAWLASVKPAFRKIFVDGVEGLPQPTAKQFAQQWAEYCGCRYGLLMAHGTDALRIALAAALDHDGLDYGGEVIVPNLSFIATAAAALDRRCGIVFVDVEPTTLLLNPRCVEEAILPGRTRAIMPVHLFGQPANMTALREIAQRYKLKLIEDAAQAHGSVWESGPVGSLGDAAAFSFQSFKNLTCGEGGALTTNDEDLFERAYSMHNVGRSRQHNQRWEHITLGWNCRITEYQAALLTSRFRDFERQQERRRNNFLKLHELLADVACVVPLSMSPGVRKHGVHMLALRYKDEECGGLPVEDFLRACGAEGAPIHRGYTCTMSAQPAMQRLMAKHPDYFRLMPTPVAEEATKNTLYIPQEVFLGVEADMTDIAAAIRKVQNHYSRIGKSMNSNPKLGAMLVGKNNG